MSKDLGRITSVRLSAEMLTRLSKRGRSSEIRKGLTYYFTARDKRRQIPVATNQELKALNNLAEQLRYVGQNLNQLCRQLHVISTGHGVLPTEHEVRDLHTEIAALCKAAKSVVAFWTTR